MSAWDRLFVFDGQDRADLAADIRATRKYFQSRAAGESIPVAVAGVDAWLINYLPRTVIARRSEVEFWREPGRGGGAV